MNDQLPEYDWAKYFEYLDTNNDGKLEYNEFKTGALNRDEMLSDANLEIVFGILDQNKDGYLDAEDL
jgi:Ca2+-binding EF-hand superfamily protein